MLFKKGCTRTSISEVVGVNRNTVGEWIKLWQEGGLKALRVKSPGAPKGSGQILDLQQQQRIRACLIEVTPDQLKLPFALWTREAVQELIKDILGIEMPIRTVGHYLQQWGCLLYTSPSPRDQRGSRMPSSA